MQARPPAISAPRDWIDWPFFDALAPGFATRLDRFVDSAAVNDIDHAAVDDACRKLVRRLGEARLSGRPSRRRRRCLGRSIFAPCVLRARR